MKISLLFVLAQAITETNLAAQTKNYTVSQGSATVIELDARTCSAAVLFENRAHRCRRDNMLILGIAADAQPGLAFIRTPGGEIVASVTITPVQWPQVRRPAGSAAKPAPEGRMQRDREAKGIALRSHLDSRWSTYHLRLPFQAPVSADHTVGDAFGLLRFYGTSQSAVLHSGADIVAVRRGEWSIHPPPVQSMTSGVVVLATTLWLEGNAVIVYHGDGVYTSYSHLSTLNVKQGDLVSIGSKLGTVGSTGHSSGAHLHLAMRINDTAVDPVSVPKILNRLLR